MMMTKSQAHSQTLLHLDAGGGLALYPIRRKSYVHKLLIMSSDSVDTVTQLLTSKKQTSSEATDSILWQAATMARSLCGTKRQRI